MCRGTITITITAVRTAFNVPSETNGAKSETAGPFLVGGDDPVTGSVEGARVEVWDLTAGGTPVGEPRTGHTGAVTAVATAALPDGRAAAYFPHARAPVLVAHSSPSARP